MIPLLTQIKSWLIMELNNRDEKETHTLPRQRLKWASGLSSPLLLPPDCYGQHIDGKNLVLSCLNILNSLSFILSDEKCGGDHGGEYVECHACDGQHKELCKRRKYGMLKSWNMFGLIDQGQFVHVVNFVHYMCNKCSAKSIATARSSAKIKADKANVFVAFVNDFCDSG